MQQISQFDKISIVALTLAALGGVEMPLFKEKSKPPIKPCLNCGTLKQHNNHFCSASY